MGTARGQPEEGRGRRPLEPGRPLPGLWWLRSFDGRSARSKAVRVGLAVAAVGLSIGLGTWGANSLKVEPRLGLPLALYRALKLYTLDLGLASGGDGALRPNWQLWVAFALAAVLVLRGVLFVLRQRVRSLVARYVLRHHVVVCGAGASGARLAQLLAQDHDVVLVDHDQNALGMAAPVGRNEWRVVGDCVLEVTLLAAGVERAHLVVVVVGHDFVGSQVVSAVRSLAKAGRLCDRTQVLVQVEDPTLARFLEEEEHERRVAAGALAAPAALGATPSSVAQVPEPVVSTFSTNAIAAGALLDEAEAEDSLGRTARLLDVGATRAPNLLLAGDHPIIEAVMLAALGRWRVQFLRQLESGTGSQRPPLHISVIGPDAVARVEAFGGRWAPEPELLSIEARDMEHGSENLDVAEDWLQSADRADHAIVACLDELDGVRLTLELSRALGGRARMTRVTARAQSALDAHLEERTLRSTELAATSVKSLSELACRPEVIRGTGGRERLAFAIAEIPVPSAEAIALSNGFFDRARVLGARRDFAWRVRPSERPILEALLHPVPLSALLRAGLRVDLARPVNLRLAAERLSADGSSSAFPAWCEYARHVHATSPTGLREALASPSKDENANMLMKLRQATLGDTRALSAIVPDGSVLKGATRVAIIAGAAGSMEESAGPEIATLLRTALYRYEGAVLSGGTAVGVPGIVGTVCADLGLSRRLVGYVPPGRAERDLYPVVRESAGAEEFSVAEPLAMWADILQAGVPLENVRVLAFPGGDIVTDEILLARALGARVAFLDPGEGAADALDYRLPLGADGVLEIPNDPMTVRAFLQWSQLPAELADDIARYVHNRYRRTARWRKSPTDPALAPWKDLLPSLKESNVAQANDIPNKLALIGMKITNGGYPLELTKEEILLLGEAEHGRWNIERLSAGWRLGDRQPRRRISPHLKPWADLDDATKAYDFEAVENIGPALAEAGWGVVEPRSP